MRPQPPSDNDYGFEPDQDGLGAWAFETFIDHDGALHNPLHEHLEHASIGWLWTDEEAKNNGKIILGECRLVQPQQSRWSSAMAHFQIKGWFGTTPDFIITISAEAAREMDDVSFCALIEHELLHAGQALDEYGSPRFRRDGSPVYGLKPHDLEEFVSVVERYGAASPDIAAFLAAADQKPSVGRASIGAACGTCHLRRAA